MMRVTDLALMFFASVATMNMAHAKTNPACLDHLGGSASDMLCYRGLTNDIVADNQATYQTLHKSIPAGNPNVKLLDDYMASENEASRFCMLDKQAGTGWKASATPNFANEWDVVYAQCVYEQRLAQNRRLHSLLPDANAGK